MSSIPLHIKLISGTFEPATAADVLLSLLNEKIKYHTVKSLNLNNSETDHSYSKERIKDLRAAKNSVIEAVLEANKKGIHLDIEGSIALKMRTYEERGNSAKHGLSPAD